MSQIITIGPDGRVSGLQRKRNQGVSLKSLGHAEIERVSEIVWNELAQRWTVRILNENVCQWVAEQAGRTHVFEGATLILGAWAAAGISDMPDGAVVLGPEGGEWLGFDEYEDGVAAEVAFLDALRLKGVF